MNTYALQPISTESNKGNEGLVIGRSLLSLLPSVQIRCLCLSLVLLFSASAVSAATRYVWQGSPSPAPPYDSWATAATNIQDAVDAADPGDESADWKAVTNHHLSKRKSALIRVDLRFNALA